MKYWGLIILLLIHIGLFGQTWNIGDTILPLYPNDTEIHYNFTDGSAVDLSTQSNNPQSISGEKIKGYFDGHNGAIRFEEIGANLELTAPINFDGDYTIICWAKLKPKELFVSGSLFEGQGGVTHPLFYYAITGQIGVQDNDPITFQYKHFSSGYSYWDLGEGWHQIIVVGNEATKESDFYFDGIQEGRSFHKVIGNYTNVISPSKPFGDVDELVVFKRALSSTEIYNAYGGIFNARLADSNVCKGEQVDFKLNISQDSVAYQLIDITQGNVVMSNEYLGNRDALKISSFPINHNASIKIRAHNLVTGEKLILDTVFSINVNNSLSKDIIPNLQNVCDKQHVLSVADVHQDASYMWLNLQGDTISLSDTTTIYKGGNYILNAQSEGCNVFDTTYVVFNKIYNLGETSTDFLSNENLLIYIPFNNEIRDESSYNTPLVEVNTLTLTYDRFQNQRQAINTYNSYIEVTDYSHIDFSSSFTFSVWARATEFPEDVAFIFDYGSVAEYGVGMSFDSDVSFKCYFIGNSLVTQAQLFGWHHYVFTFDGEILTMYVDGKATISQYAEHIGEYFINTANPLRIGCQSKWVGRQWYGDIDEFRAYNVALTPDQVHTLFKVDNELFSFSPKSNAIEFTIVESIDCPGDKLSVSILNAQDDISYSLISGAQDMTWDGGLLVDSSFQIRSVPLFLNDTLSIQAQGSNNCSILLDTTIVISDFPPKASITGKEIYCNNEVIELSVDDTDIPEEYALEWLVNNEVLFNDVYYVSLDSYNHNDTIIAQFKKNKVECTQVQSFDTYLVSISDTCYQISIYEFISRNNDGINDVFFIENIEFFPEHTITIFDIYGSKIFETNEYKNDWKGDNLPVGEYYYRVKIQSAIYEGELYIK